ncbi:sulfite exporter TauE/SafE family protein [Metallumcola ferriviriculae]|uniref:Probable membrane transporter protein n=1 Tax=Metallumcola ferriviriculae TaxID=3039180 RepID=A0AAU0UKE8_9FIRM|nr:sulfite exporter TauE/SafE family protein [Desulfitibacteraceae bacterium MK1]
MPVPYIILILITGIAAGFINTLAGGGSLLTMPMLIFLGLPSAMANGTNRIALMVQNIVAITNFRRKGFFDWRLSLMLGIPAVLGSVLGANLAISLPDNVFNKILAVVMLLVLVLILWQPQKRLEASEENLSKKSKIIAVITFFFVGIYGGFIQAGVGFIIIASLTLITGMSLVRVNSIKVFVVAIYMVSSLAIFIISGQVNWVLGLTLAVGHGLGGWLGSNFAVAKGDKWIRVFLVIAVVMMAAKLLGVFELFA